ncbi:MAG: peptidylprolyl isomerase [Catenibacterium sp.]|uniref:peptidylprolyl isomerase n=1 Tax=Catenibacterium sp. TaxID=2049022 RepID=UPI002E7786F3|nr:peptidylprolyl isomerase [Catenibacterium sp.]MEE0491612.1 peptidylprolyl isomerase [Catenibacterium sp.]
MLTGYYDCEIKVKNYGSIKLKLDANTAPITVSNFVGLANEGFYNRLTFHRIIKRFMIQGGDPNGDGTGGSKQTIKGEFTANGVDNPIKHTRGVISMARSQSYDSASSQFFIMHEDAPSLDGQYAAFGCAYSGMDIVDKICDDVKTEDSNGTVSKKNQPVIESITCTKIQ